MPIQCKECSRIDENVDEGKCSCGSRETFQIAGFTPRRRQKYIKKNIFGGQEIVWDGQIDLEKLIGDGNPRSWKETESGCYFVKYFDTHTGTTRIGKACGVTRHRDGRITIKLKTPEDFYMLGEKDVEKNGIRTKRKYKKRKVGQSNHISINNIFYALHPHKRTRMKGGKENRLEIISEKGAIKEKKQTGLQRCSGRWVKAQIKGRMSDKGKKKVRRNASK